MIAVCKAGRRRQRPPGTVRRSRKALGCDLQSQPPTGLGYLQAITHASPDLARWVLSQLHTAVPSIVRNDLCCKSSPLTTYLQIAQTLICLHLTNLQLCNVLCAKIHETEQIVKQPRGMATTVSRPHLQLCCNLLSRTVTYHKQDSASDVLYNRQSRFAIRGDERIPTTCLAVLTPYRSVVDGWTDRRTNGTAPAISRVL